MTKLPLTRYLAVGYLALGYLALRYLALRHLALRHLALRYLALKGTGFSPYVNDCNADRGFSPGGIDVS